jgi:hypothetical protein
MAGYSQRTLAQKLGFAAGQRVCVVQPPAGYRELLGPLPGGLRWSKTLRGRFDLVHCFTRSGADLIRRLPRLRDATEVDGSLWISWPKRSSGVATDLTEDVIRRLALDGGMVDVKVCAVDEVWSGLKLVFRKANRPGIAAQRGDGRGRGRER